ncbi:HEPN domain-containing protein [Leptolyngbya sp. 7M]|uniref:HEPN domain-containing protein n=1 Tax=Leptolyngbya sp. 7M TaxID=2812896 RepID=UPI001B8D56BE|nr:HEPN domain-containing protein [Leptolyngbya sp. 7M]QYO64986.1 hypothetical protein JVX88_36600 [Leptolyngbya sp. 7M]
MARSDLDTHFARIDALVKEIGQFVPNNTANAVQFRADLAGLLVVTISATYESCVKDTLFEFANRHHTSFGEYTLRRYKRLNSQIKLNDLNNYCRIFDDAVYKKYRTLLTKRSRKISERIGKDIQKSYEQILNWRHAFAHQGARNTTIEEAVCTHKLAKRVLYTFDEAFNGK